LTDPVIRLAVDINVWYADLLVSQRGRLGTAARYIADAVRAGVCPAGPVQLIASVPVIENWASVLQRRFGYSLQDANEQAGLLYDYAADGAVGVPPSIVVGSGYVPFADEAAERQAAATKGDKLFNEIEDDRHVLLSAIAGDAHILVTSDVDDFNRGSAQSFNGRADVIVYPTAAAGLVIAKPTFVRHWLQQGIVPDANVIAELLQEPSRPRYLRGCAGE
jgi:hypothetical protein